MSETDLGADLEPDIETRAARIAVHLSAHALVEKVATTKTTTLCCFEKPKRPRGIEEYYLFTNIENFYSGLARMGRASDDGHSILKSTKYTKKMPITLEKAAEQAALETISFFQRKNTKHEHLKELEKKEATYARVLKVKNIGDKMMDVSIKSTKKEVGQAMHDKLISGRNLYYETKRPEVLAEKKRRIEDENKTEYKEVHDTYTNRLYWDKVQASPKEADITLILKKNWNGLSKHEKENWEAVAREEEVKAARGAGVTEGRAAMRAEVEAAYEKAKEEGAKPMVGGEGDEEKPRGVSYADKLLGVDILLGRLNEARMVANNDEEQSSEDYERISDRIAAALMMLKRAKIQIAPEPHQDDCAKILELQWKRLRAYYPRVPDANLRNELTELLKENYKNHPDVVTALMNEVDFNQTDIVFTEQEDEELRALLAKVDSIAWQMETRWRALLTGREPIKEVKEKLLQLNLLIERLGAAARLNASDRAILNKLEFAIRVVKKKQADIRIDTLTKMQDLRQEDKITRFLKYLKTNVSELDQQMKRIQADYNFIRNDLTDLPMGHYDDQTELLSELLSKLLNEVDFSNEEERRDKANTALEDIDQRIHDYPEKLRLQAEAEAKAKAEAAEAKVKAVEEARRREEAGEAYRLKAPAEEEWNKAEIAATEKVKIRHFKMFEDLKNLENIVNNPSESNKIIVEQQKRAVRAAVHASVHVLVAAEAAEEAYQVNAATKAYHVMENDKTDKRKFNGCTTHRDAIENFLQAAIAGVAPAASAMATKILALRVLYEYNRPNRPYTLTNREAAALFIVEAINDANEEAKAATVAAEETYNAFNLALRAATSAVNVSSSAFTKAVEAEDAAFTKAVEAEDAAFACAVKAEEAQFPVKTPNVNYKQQVQKMMDLVERAKKAAAVLAEERWNTILMYSGVSNGLDVLKKGQEKEVEKKQAIFNTLGTRLFKKMVQEEEEEAKSESAKGEGVNKMEQKKEEEAEEAAEAIEVAAKERMAAEKAAAKEEGVKYREKVNNMATALFNLQLVRSQRNIFIATNHGYINNVEKDKDDKYNYDYIAEELKIHNDNVKKYKEKFQTIKENTGTTKYTDTVEWIPVPIRPMTARILPKFFSRTGGSNKKTKRKRKTKRKKQNKRKTKRKKQNKRKTKRKRKSIKRR